MDNYVPLDVLENHIFVRLSAKSVVNCSCVCKQWQHILYGSEFKKIHIRHQIKDDRHHQIVICGPLKYTYGYKYNYENHNPGIFYSLDLESASPKLNRLPGFPDHLMKHFELVRTLGYSNGMLCMEARNTLKPVWPHIFFGNPSTGYYKVFGNPLPVVRGALIVGFGYDSYSDDYKFVRINNITRHPHIYSLKSNSWSTNLKSRSNKHKNNLEDSFMQGFVSEGLFANGSIYWFASMSIVRFDLKDEKFYTELPMPRSFHYGHISLKVVQGSLCMMEVVNHTFPRRGEINVKMWLLKSKEVEKNNITEKKYYWINLLKLNDQKAKHIYPFAIMKDGRVVCCVEYEDEIRELPPKSQYILVDPRTSKSQNFTISGINDGILRDFIFQSPHSGYIDTFISPH